jgi:hypothetical protein
MIETSYSSEILKFKIEMNENISYLQRIYALLPYRGCQITERKKLKVNLIISS